METYSPYWGGSPASDAYAIPSGIAKAASVSPAIRSNRSHFRSYLGSQESTGI